MRWNKPSRDQAHGTTTGHLVIVVGEVSGQARLEERLLKSEGLSKHIQTAALSAKEAILRFQRTDPLMATPARQKYSDKLENARTI